MFLIIVGMGILILIIGIPIILSQRAITLSSQMESADVVTSSTTFVTTPINPSSTTVRDPKDKPLTFIPYIEYKNISSPIRITTGDINGDNHTDLIITNEYVNVFFGDGNGMFTTQVRTPLPANITYILVGDCNGDNRQDLIAIYGLDAMASVLLGRDDRKFATIISSSLDANPRDQDFGSGPTSGAVGDFNGDNFLDLVINYNVALHIYVLLGYGNGSFGQAIPYMAYYQQGTPVVTDFNNDNCLDIAVTSLDYCRCTLILFGYCNGTFRTVAPRETIPNPATIVIADLNGDKNQDFATSDDVSLIGVSLGNGDGFFRTPILDLPLSGTFKNLAAGDVNCDTYIDLIMGSNSTNYMSIFLGFGNGNFEPVTFNTTGSITSFALDDLNGDGHLDIVTHCSVYVTFTYLS
ncbi:unnamed protein product [Adineta steineri]|uniref:VCBS repeat-containing protein n=1 Tax=Adineta steineri TaxID=433720 RepID=A0A818J7C0_9BILA|nr:unnamed protein product [Adineta steineri]CAF1384508.1 unnamed protein product [Adineta steineri]CAF3539475.1 unnamed protein product [Adineta steineri]CAF3787608.1 unnamed protein product [Adineta steineri]CAF4114113.1 unnamed protein product [Adineta steineri]